jgi:hypothetical protein
LRNLAFEWVRQNNSFTTVVLLLGCPRPLVLPSFIQAPFKTGIDMNMMSKKMFLKSALALSAAMLAGSVLAASPPTSSWELSGEFNSGNNAPGSVWNYGWKSPPSLLFQPFVQPKNILSGNLLGWVRAPNLDLPTIFHNKNATPLLVAAAGGSTNLIFAARGVVMHPGTSGEVATVRFNPPSPGQYRISGQFYAQDGSGSGTHTDVEVKRIPASNGPPQMLFAGSVIYPNAIQQAFTSKVVMLGPNEKLDFDVRAGAGNNYWYGSTGVHAVIERVGEYCGGNPSTC